MLSLTKPLAAGSTLLFEGDSLTRFAMGPHIDTWPWMRLNGAHYGYPDRVGDWIFCHRPDLRLGLRTGAIGGSVIADVLARFPTIAAPCRPAVVVLTIGGNDAARGVPLADFSAAADEYCRRLRELCDGQVLYLGNILAAPGASVEGAKRREAARPYYVAMADAAERHGGVAVDLGTVLVRKAAALAAWHPAHGIYHDGVHFNQVGNEIVAGVVLRALGLIETPGDPSMA